MATPSSTSTSSSSPGPLSSSSLRRLMSLDSPRVALGKRCDLVEQDIINQGSSSSSSLSPEEVPIIAIKREPGDLSPLSPRFSCSLCTERPGDEKLTSFRPPDPRRAQHLASLLGRSEEEVDIIFCSVCRQTVTKLFNLKEEVEEIESRIRAVVKLHPTKNPLAYLDAVKVDCCPPSEDSPSASSADVISFPQHQDLTSSIVLEEPKSYNNADGHDDTIPTPNDGAQAPGQKSFRAGGRPRKHKNMQKRRMVDVATLPLITSMKEGDRTLFHCPQCPQKFTFKHNVFAHLRKNHGRNVLIKMVCPICKKVFRNNDLFKAHSHPDKNDPSMVSYTCQLCPKIFVSAENLERHKRKVRLKNYQSTCSHCGKQFQWKQSLQHHSKTCGVPPEEQRKCHCGQVFATWVERLDHERVVHKKLGSTKCYFCTKTLSSSRSLLKHLRIHTRERPFLCVICGKDFADPNNFRYHMAAVCGTDEKKKKEIQRRNRDRARRFLAKLLYPCELCAKKFGTTRGLKRHQKRGH